MKNRLLMGICLLAAAALAGAQTADEIEALLAADTVSYGKAAEVAAKASGNEVALADWLPKNASEGDAARFDAVSLLLIKSFNFKGGAFYSMAKNPHYAYRELVYKKVIQGRAAPGRKVSGEEYLFMVNRCLALEEQIDAEVAERDRKAAEKEARLAAEKARKEAAQREAERARLAQEINTELATMKIVDTTAAVSDEGVTINLSNIQFVANSAELQESEKQKIATIAQILQNVKAKRLLIAGHTALAGTLAEQIETSYDRARAVRDYIVSLGARSEDDIAIEGFGASRPIAGNDTPEGMAQNRRVEITILE